MGLFNFKRAVAPKEPAPAARYLEHLDSIFHQEPEIYREESLIPGLPGVSTFVYKDIPEKGRITALTYGLSLVAHPGWKYGRAELCLSVKSSERAWGKVVGHVANKLRGDCPFSYGQVIHFGQRISDDSEMNAFFVFAPSTLYKEDYLAIDIGAAYKISIAGLYPMYGEEMELFRDIGLEAFWRHPGFDNYDVNRPRIAPLKKQAIWK